MMSLIYIFFMALAIWQKYVKEKSPGNIFHFSKRINMYKSTYKGLALSAKKVEFNV